ncbi:MAG: ATP-binding protein [Pseudomonadota bacterium]
MRRVLQALAPGDRLGLRLVIASLIVGSVLSVVTTALQLSASYVRQRSDATQVLGRVEETLVSSLERAIWTFDFAQVNIILDGLSSDPNIAFVEVRTTTGESWQRGALPSGPTQSGVGQAYDVRHDFDDGQSETVGTLHVHVSLDAVRARVWAEFWTTFVTNLAKAYLAAGALLFLVNRMISRHLRRIAAYVDDGEHARRAPLELERGRSVAPDDLDRIVDAVARYEARTRDQMDALTSEITVRELAETEAREALSIRSRFLATMSHEIRTPLNAIMGFLHLIESFKGIPDKPRIYAQTATKASHQLMGLMNNSLDMSRLEAKAVEIRLEQTDLTRLAHDWHQGAEGIRHLRGKDIDITLDVDPNLPPLVMMDGPHVTQIVSNLIDNAVKFTDAGQVGITVTACATDDGAQGIDISVSDTGGGIPEDARARIFERFTQADSGIMRAHGGSGLGLAICSELARLMGATLRLEDRMRDGFATVFLLRLDNVGGLDIGK